MMVGRLGAAALVLGLSSMVAACGATPEKQRAEILQNGKVVRTVNLSEVMEPEELTLTCDSGRNTIYIAPKEIRMQSADCPDQICVKSGKLIEGGLPIVCLPHRLVIQWAD